MSVRTNLDTDTGTSKEFFIGIDPGVGGGVAVLDGLGQVENLRAFGNMSPRDVADLLETYRHEAGRPFAVVEKQIPRPTRWFNPKAGGWQQSILRSTCVLYGHYMLLRGMLCSLRLPYDDCDPKRWQRALGIPPREKREEERHWKNRLKEATQRLFPSEKVVLATCDALLLAEYCRRLRTSEVSRRGRRVAT